MFILCSLKQIEFNVLFLGDIFSLYLNILFFMYVIKILYIYGCMLFVYNYINKIC